MQAVGRHTQSSHHRILSEDSRWDRWDRWDSYNVENLSQMGQKNILRKKILLSGVGCVSYNVTLSGTGGGKWRPTPFSPDSLCQCVP